MKHMGSEREISKSKGSSIRRAKARIPHISSPQLRFVVCVKSGGYVDLEPLKVYKVCRDSAAKAQGMLRVVDGSGENYLYPQEFFRPIHAPQKLLEIVKEFA